MMTKELVPYDPTSELQGIIQLAEVFVKSGRFPTEKDANQVAIKIIAGRELNLGPFESLSNIFFINNVRSFSYPLVGALIQRSGRFRYKVVEENGTSVKLEWFERMPETGLWESLGFSDYSEEDARIAGLLGKDNWKKYKKDLLFARALTRGARRFCSSVFGGGVYTKDELEDSMNVTVEGSTDDLKSLTIDAFVEKVKAEIDETLTKDVVVNLLKGGNFGGWKTANKRTMFDWLKAVHKPVQEGEFQIEQEQTES